MNENVTKRYRIWKLADFVRDKLKITTPITIEKLQYIIESSGGQLVAVNSLKEVDKDFDVILKLSPKGEYPYFYYYLCRLEKQRKNYFFCCA